jgi:hypothetical protein
MPQHRFYNELIHLEDNPIQGNYNILVVGTFNAADQDGLDNDAAWFYGRSANEFWYLFPQLLGMPSLHRRENPEINLDELSEKWKNFCHQNNIIIIDIYKYIDGYLPNHGDDAIANPAAYSAFNYKTAFKNTRFKNVLFTWKGRNNNTVLGTLKEQLGQWFIARGSRTLHMISPSYAYPKSKEFKLQKWMESYNNGI